MVKPQNFSDFQDWFPIFCKQVSQEWGMLDCTNKDENHASFMGALSLHNFENHL